MKSVIIIGNGQLSHMLHQAGQPLGIKTYSVSIDTEIINLPISESVITTEIEYWPDTNCLKKLSSNPLFVNREVIRILSDRLSQKKLLKSLNLKTVPWQFLGDKKSRCQLLSSLGELVIFKKRTGGYDGRKQWKFRNHEINHFVKEFYETCVIEKYINFNYEVSLIGARGKNGDIVFYPITYNLHQKGILRISIAFPKINPKQHHLEKMLTTIMNELNYVGVMAMECFITPNEIFINELAPRVHNSGHWTQNGASISQFELHLRAILNLPLSQPIVFSSSVMINLIGINMNILWLRDPLVHLYWYKKQLRIARKMGHINLTDIDHGRLCKSLQYLLSLLPNDYRNGICWAIKKLSH